MTLTLSALTTARPPRMKYLSSDRRRRQHKRWTVRHRNLHTQTPITTHYYVKNQLSETNTDSVRIYLPILAFMTKKYISYSQLLASDEILLLSLLQQGKKLGTDCCSQVTI